MKFQEFRRKRRKEVLLELTPLIDVVFLLLIFFMVSSNFVDINAGINLDLPNSNIENKAEDKEIVISIDSKRKIHINKDEVEENEIIEKLKIKLSKTNKKNVIIRGDKSIDYGTIVDIMTKSKNAGAERIDIATNLDK